MEVPTLKLYPMICPRYQHCFKQKLPNCIILSFQYIIDDKTRTEVTAISVWCFPYPV